MKLFFKKIKTTGIAIWLFILVVLFISLYFFIRLSKNDQVLEQRGFRTLIQLGKTIKEKDTVILEVVKNTTLPTTLTFSSRLGESPLKKQLYLSTSNYSNDSLVYPKKSGRNVSVNPSSRSDQSSPKNNTVGVDSLNNANNPVTPINLSQANSSSNLQGVFFKMSIKDFITPLLTRRDFFLHYVLFRNDTIVFNTFGGDAILLKEVFKKAELNKSLMSFSGDARKLAGDSTFFIQAGFSQKVKILGKNYLLFTVPLKFNSKPDWYLGGLVEERAFLSWKRNLPSEIIVAFCVLLLAIIFSFPILKVFLSGPLEKLSRIGISLTGISLIISPILIIILMSELLLSGTIKKDTLKNLSSLNEKIRLEFVQESNSILLQLKDYQNADFTRFMDTIMNNSDTVLIPSDTVIILSDTDADFFKPFKYRLFKAFFPVDTLGRQLFYLTPYKDGDISNVANRDYFRRPEKYTRIISDSLTAEEIWYNMEPIYSNTSGEWIMAFSIPTSKPAIAKIIALTSAMHSLKWPLLPEDYRFCLIEKSGKIWFDSKEIFNLSDNLIEETDNSEDLVQALKSNISSKFRANLRSKKNLMVVAPVDNTQLFIVTMFDSAVNNTMEALSATYVIAFFTVIYSSLFLLIILIKLIRHKNSKLHGRAYFFSWLTPKESKADVYKILLVFNGIIILILFGLSFSDTFTRLDLNTFVWIFLIFVSIHFPVLYLIRSYLKVNDAVLQKLKKHIPNYVKISLLMGMNNKGFNFKIFSDSYLTLFTIFLFSSLLVSSILPAMFMMSRFSTEENKLSIIRQQHYLAYKINTRTELIKDFSDLNYPNSQRIKFLNKRNQYGHYYQSVCASSGNSYNEFVENIENSYLLSPFINLRRAEYQEMMGLETPLINDLVSNSKSLYSKTDDKIKLTFDSLSYVENGDKVIKSESLFSKEVGLELYKPINRLGKWKWSTAIFWGAFIIVMLLLYLLIKNVVKLLFPYQELGFKGVDIDKLSENVKINNKNVVVVSLNKDDEKLTNEQLFCRINLADFQSKQSISDHRMMLLINFEKGINNPLDLEKRLKLLEIFLKQKPVILLLSETPSQLVNYYNHLWKNELNQELCKSQISHFVRMVAGLAVFYTASNLSKKKKMKDSGTFELILKKELAFNPTFEEFVPFLELEFGDIRKIAGTSDSQTLSKTEIAAKREDFILKIQEYAHPFYDAVWNSLSKEEQFVLMDLAEDSIVNMNNRDCLQSLINKGILKLNDNLEFSSESFRNFILTDVDKTELDAMQKTVQITGNWSRLRIPLILIAVSIAIFLFVTQQNFLSNLNTFLVSIITIAGTFLRFSGMFSKGKVV